MMDLLELRAEVENRSQKVVEYRGMKMYNKALEEIRGIEKVINEVEKIFKEKERELEERLENDFNLTSIDRTILTQRLFVLDENELHFIRSMKEKIEKTKEDIIKQKGMMNMNNLKINEMRLKYREIVKILSEDDKYNYLLEDAYYESEAIGGDLEDYIVYNIDYIEGDKKFEYLKLGIDTEEWENKLIEDLGFYLGEEYSYESFIKEKYKMLIGAQKEAERMKKRRGVDRLIASTFITQAASILEKDPNVDYPIHLRKTYNMVDTSIYYELKESKKKLMVMKTKQYNESMQYMYTEEIMIEDLKEIHKQLFYIYGFQKDIPNHIVLEKGIKDLHRYLIEKGMYR